MPIRWSTEVPQAALVVLMFVLGGSSWSTAPESVPVHWGVSGQPDRYGGKLEGLFALPAITLAMYLLMLFLPRLDPRRERYREFWGPYTVLRASLLLFMAAVYVLILLSIHGQPVDMAIAVSTLGGLLLAVIGLVMPRLRPTWFVGIRTPWTLTSERSWVATHRLGGWLFAASGILLAVAGLLHSDLLTMGAIAFFVLSLLVLIGYSYRVWSADADRRQEA